MSGEDGGAHEGGCLCGQLRYRLARIRSAYWCHCTMCRRASGAGALPWASVARADFAFTAGTPAEFESSPGVRRSFCRKCGSPILFAMASESEVDVTLGTLDVPDAVAPSHHIWTRSALAMTDGLGLGLPRYDQERHDQERPEPDGGKAESPPSGRSGSRL